MVVNTPSSSKRTPASSSKLKPDRHATPSPLANMGQAAREITPELPTEDKSPSPDSVDEDMQDEEADYDAETQETAMVPDSVHATPVASLPGLGSSAVRRMNMMYEQAAKENEPITPSKLSQDHLKKLQEDLLLDEGATLADMLVPMEDDSITLQSDLTIADLDPNDWKELAISYGAEPRADDEGDMDSLAPPTSNGSRRRKTSNASATARQGSRASKRLEAKVLTPSKPAHLNGAAVTPVRSTGRSIKTYGKRSHRASTSTSSEADMCKSQRTSGTTSGESDCIEVTTERRTAALRHVTPDGSILPSVYAASPSKAHTSVNGKGKARDIVPSSHDDDDLDMSMPKLTPAKKDKGKSPEKQAAAKNRATRASDRDQDEIMRNKIGTPSLSPPRAQPEPFVPLTTATEGIALSAMELIARMRANNKGGSDSEEEKEAAQKSGEESDTSLQLYGNLNLLKKSTAMEQEDSDDDDLVDTKVLLNQAKNAPRRPEKKASPAAVERAASTVPVKKVKLPMDKASQSLNKLFKTRQAEEARGWFGIDEASRDVAENSTRNGSTSPATDDGQANGGNESDSDGSDSSSLPDGLPTSTQKPASSASKPKKARRYSNGQLKRVVTQLTKSKEDEGVVEAIKAAHDELEEAQLRAKRRREQERRRFWKKTDSELKIEPFEPYETAGTKGLDYALRQGVLDGLLNPMNFPTELVSPVFSSTTAMFSSIPATYSLYRLIAHPCTDARLANRVLPSFQTILRKIPSGGALDVDIDLSSIVDSLNAMGAKKDLLTDELRSSAAIENTPEAMAVDAPKKQAFSIEQRQSATLRIMSVLRTLVETKRIESSKCPSLAILLLRMSLDTSDHLMRDAAIKTLDVLLAQINDQDTLLSILEDVFRLVEPLSFRDRYVVLSFLPFNSESQRSLVRGLCYSLLFPVEDQQLKLINGQATLPLLSSAMAKRSPQSIFYITSDIDDVSLFYSILLLQYLMTDLSTFLIEDVFSQDADVCTRSQKARDDAQHVISGLTDIDSKLRTDVRTGNPMRNKAKNALARTQHTLEYHLNSAQARADKVSLKRRLGERTLAQPVEGKVGQGQIAINSYFTKVVKPADVSTSSNPGNSYSKLLSLPFQQSP